jgi:predicted polyphosphate/ATP-dependent NAD kinase
MIEDVYANRLHPKTAAGLTPLFNTMLRALSAEDTEGRVRQMEKKLQDLLGGGATDGGNGTAREPEAKD